ncbi:gastrula zinc finger protein XlCGF57.1-like [Pimephales promelas]|nr:gastrula zinc finger protein XlCGF57.1-like [Pimephales promelas]
MALIKQESEDIKIEEVFSLKQEDTEEQTVHRVLRKAHNSVEEALQITLDSKEEFSFSSEEDCNSDDERLHFEERIDPAEDTSSENVSASRSPSPAPRRAKRRCHTE